VDIVLECSGKFRTPEQLAPYFERGVKKVIVAAPVKGGGALNIVMGVNDHLYDAPRTIAADQRVLHDQLPRARS
jgi:glyceraldehyde 3-phosphate dehydrogenase